MAWGEVLLRILGEHPTFGGDAPHRQVWTPGKLPWKDEQVTGVSKRNGKDVFSTYTFLFWSMFSWSLRLLFSKDAEHSRTSDIGTLCSIEHRNEWFKNFDPIHFFLGPLGKRICGTRSNWLHLDSLSAYLPKPERLCLGWDFCDGCGGGRFHKFGGTYLRSGTFLH